MEPCIDIKPGLECRTIFARNQPQYQPLPGWRGADGSVVTRWKLSWRERLAVFFGGHVWLTVLTFHHPLQPVKITTVCPPLTAQTVKQLLDSANSESEKS